MVNMEDDKSSNSAPILLGKPFLKWPRKKIDVSNDTLTMEFDSEIINFNIFDAMKYPIDCHSCLSIDIIDVLSQQAIDFSGRDVTEMVINNGLWSGNECL